MFTLTLREISSSPTQKQGIAAISRTWCSVQLSPGDQHAKTPKVPLISKEMRKSLIKRQELRNHESRLGLETVGIEVSSRLDELRSTLLNAFGTKRRVVWPNSIWFEFVELCVERAINWPVARS